MAGASYGLLAGTISSGASLEEVRILGSTLQIDSGCYFGVDDYVIGLVCGMGNADAVAEFEIDCAAVGDQPESLVISVSDNEVTLEFVSE